MREIRLNAEEITIQVAQSTNRSRGTSEAVEKTGRAAESPEGRGVDERSGQCIPKR